MKIYNKSYFLLLSSVLFTIACKPKPLAIEEVTPLVNSQLGYPKIVATKFYLEDCTIYKGSFISANKPLVMAVLVRQTGKNTFGGCMFWSMTDEGKKYVLGELYTAKDDLGNDIGKCVNVIDYTIEVNGNDGRTAIDSKHFTETINFTKTYSPFGKNKFSLTHDGEYKDEFIKETVHFVYDDGKWRCYK